VPTNRGPGIYPAFCWVLTDVVARLWKEINRCRSWHLWRSTKLLTAQTHHLHWQHELFKSTCSGPSIACRHRQPTNSGAWMATTRGGTEMGAVVTRWRQDSLALIARLCCVSRTRIANHVH
jgi:hypothetical protein